jgi:N-acetylmuramoyl-L-alanine amidase
MLAHRLVALLGLTAYVLFTVAATAEEVGDKLERKGDEIVVCGQLFHTTAPVVLWMDPAGYDAYRVERRFVPFEKSDWETTQADTEISTPNRYGIRKDTLTDDQLEQVRGGGWDLPLLQEVVDQFVIHYDVCGVSQTCFKVLHDGRGLSVHFMLDIDGTIYQTLDLKERAWHATTSNSRSIGIEIAQIGAYTADKLDTLDRWYRKDSNGVVTLIFPRSVDLSSIRTPNFIGHPARPELIEGIIQKTPYYQYDFTPEQYDSLIKLTATLCKVFPQIKCDYPKDASGNLILHVMPEDELNNYQGVLGHYHVQANKQDPGPAFDWDKVIGGARELLK